MSLCDCPRAVAVSYPVPNYQQPPILRAEQSLSFGNPWDFGLISYFALILEGLLFHSDKRWYTTVNLIHDGGLRAPAGPCKGGEDSTGQGREREIVTGRMRQSLRD